MASAHEAQCAGAVRCVALISPKPTIARGRWALAIASTGSVSICKSRVASADFKVVVLSKVCGL